MSGKLMMAVLLSTLLATPLSASEWKSDESGWRYQNDDGSYLNSGWAWVDGKCYYFTPGGYCLLDTKTPDGYTVDASGAWTVDGVVQTRGVAQLDNSQSDEAFQCGGLSITAPNGFAYEYDEANAILFSNEDRRAIVSISAGAISEEIKYVDTRQEAILDHIVIESFGANFDKSVKQLTSGTWYCYAFSDASVLRIPGTISVYFRIHDSELQFVMFGGDLDGMDLDGIMNKNIR